MDNPFVLLGLFIFFLLWLLERSLVNWRIEQGKKIDEIKNTVSRIESYLEEKFD